MDTNTSNRPGGIEPKIFEARNNRHFFARCMAYLCTMRFLLPALLLISLSGFSQTFEKNQAAACSRTRIYEKSPVVQSVTKPHARRQRQFDVKFYHLDLNIENSTNAISGNVMIRCGAITNDLDTIALELHANLNIDSVTASLDGNQFLPASVNRNGKELNVILPFSANSGQQVQTRIFYRGTPPVSGSFPTSGFFSGNGHKFSATPPYNAYTWFPCKQDLTDKADSSWFFITTSQNLKAVSNGRLEQIVTLPDNKRRWEWKSSYPIAYYLIAFVVGNYTENSFYWKPSGRSDSMLVSYYNYGNSQTPQILQVFSDLFGLYPFYKEKLAMAGISLGGGIENQTIIGMGQGAPESHEIMHQWFGDHVTAASWKDIMLSEGFAEWGISIWDEFKTGTSNPAARISRCNVYETNALTNGGSVYGQNMDTSTVIGVFLSKNLYYDKAAMIINTLRFEINNDELFFQGLRNYLSQYGGKSASAKELKQVMEQTTGMDLEDFFNHWYYGQGYPRFNIRWNNKLDSLYLQISEVTNAASNPLIKTSLELKLERTTGDTTIRLFIDKNIASFKIPVSGTVTGIVVDPNQWILNGKGTITPDEALSLGHINQMPQWVAVPNPAKDQLTLVSNMKSGKSLYLLIMDLSGRIVCSKQVKINESFDLPELKPGIYLLSTGDGRMERLLLTP
jgi:aminopeptidase N